MILKKQVLIAILILATTDILAETIPQQPFQLAQQGVVSTNASGETQTTFVDENGNLKMVPMGAQPSHSKQPAKLPPKPGQTTQPAAPSMPSSAEGQPVNPSQQDSMMQAPPPPSPIQSPANGQNPPPTDPGIHAPLNNSPATEKQPQTTPEPMLPPSGPQQ